MKGYFSENLRELRKKILILQQKRNNLEQTLQQTYSNSSLSTIFDIIRCYQPKVTNIANSSTCDGSFP